MGNPLAKNGHTNDFAIVYLSELVDIKEHKQESKKLTKDIETLNLEIASIGKSYWPEPADLKRQRDKVEKKKENYLKELKSKGKAAKETERLTAEIKMLDSEIAWIAKVDVLSEVKAIKRSKEKDLSELQSKPKADTDIKKIKKEIETLNLHIASIQKVLPSKKLSAQTGLMGLSLSGGGIRSGTFNLGLLQALCNNDMLEKDHYLSTVSGGGYIGACMTTLLNSEPESESIGLTEGTFPLGRKKIGNDGKRAQEKDPVRRLRYFSNYLTAEGGFVVKYLRPAMVFLRGVVLNFLLLIPYLIALTLILSLFLNLKIILPGVKNNLLFFDMQEFRQSLEDSKAAHQKAQSDLKMYSLRQTVDLDIDSEAERIEIAKSLLASQSKYKELNAEIDAALNPTKQEWQAIWIIPAGFFALLIIAAMLLRAFYSQPYDERQIFSTVLAWLLFFSLLSLAVQLYGILIVYWEKWNITSWIASISLFSFVVPRLLQSADATDAKGKKPWVKLAISFGLLALVPLFLLYLTGVAISYVTDAKHTTIAVPALIIAFVVFAVLNRRFINLNEISLHNFYRDRLSRAYLFKYNPNSQPTTKHCDDIKLSKLKSKNAPYHIFNTVLNLSRKLPGTETEDKGVFRNGESFVFTKNWCGSEITGYCSTEKYEAVDPHINVGTAVAISGAAANIGMAHKNIFSVRLLMGLLNVRLGYWALHPKKAIEGVKSSLLRGFPGSFQAMQEWFGRYKLETKWFLRFKHESRYINLSDGGHFDNIGVYELLRRRCKYIIVGDAEADTDMKFEALSYILRLARIDFGIEIDINTADIKPDPASGLSRNHCAVGRIIYPEGDLGYLLYFKASLTGDEPEHLHEYKVKHPQFPHQTTADQWFDEQQFEAYRELGYHIGTSALAPLDLTKTYETEELFNRLKEFWHPHSEAVETSFTRHTLELNKIVSEIKNDEDLKFMDAQMYPEWECLILQQSAPAPPTSNLWLPSTNNEIRKGFYLCNLMIQLMENVYTDMKLEYEHNHPDNRGWMNLFRHWAWSGMFRVTWTISASTYGARFQKFCEKHLDLDLGELIVERRRDRDKTIKTELNPYEQKIVRNFKRGNKYLFRTIFLFKLKVSDPLDQSHHKTFHFGFALVNDKKKIIFFRVQDHLRQMGLGRKALKKMMGSGYVAQFSKMEFLKIIRAKKDPDAIPIPEQDLNRFERMCIQLGVVIE
jgi:hypothetical protein